MKSVLEFYNWHETVLAISPFVSGGEILDTNLSINVKDTVYMSEI
jgi:hypothetical protein